ncbi:hypothetical protein SELMODRAFT_411, partial [Selaginella moellendorffii]
GRMVHSHARELGLGGLASLMNAVMNMYARCGSLEEAVQVFAEIRKDLISWNTIIGAYVHHAHYEEAINLFQQMQLQGFPPDKITLLAMLKVCSNSKFFLKSKLIHACVVELGDEVELAAAIMGMYGKCGNLEASATVFSSSAFQQSPATWNSRLAALSQEGQSTEALVLYSCMLLQGVMPDRVTFLALLDVAATLEARPVVEGLHGHIIQRGYARDTFVATALLDTYSKCGRLEEARCVFETLSLGDRNVVCWTAMVSAYGQHGFFGEALLYFQLMQLQGEAPNKVTMAAVLTACSKVELEADELKSVMRVYRCCVELGHDRELVVGNAALSVHAKLGNLREAREIFSRMWTRNVVSWNSILSACAQVGESRECRCLFRHMLLESDSRPDNYTFITILGVCKQSREDLTHGRLLHQLARESSGSLDLIVATALVHMYSECGSLEDAATTFGTIQQPDVVSWNAMISALSHYGEFQRVFDLFQRMKDSKVAPDSLTFVAVLNACTANSELELGQRVFSEAVRAGFGAEVAAAGINLFGKCGKLEAAVETFLTLVPHEKSLLAWNGLATALAHGARPSEVIRVLECMRLSGIDPDLVTFVSVLSTLSHAGFVEACCYQLSSMSTDHGLTPSATHYCCVIDVLGRAGLLDEAEEMVAVKLRNRRQELSSSRSSGGSGDDPLVVLWTSFLAACGIHGDSERGKRAVERILARQPEDAATYVVLSNIASLGG